MFGDIKNWADKNLYTPEDPAPMRIDCTDDEAMSIFRAELAEQAKHVEKQYWFDKPLMPMKKIGESRIDTELRLLALICLIPTIVASIALL
jgi:hypothetical protein